MHVTFLECARCGVRHERARLHNLCRECGRPLLVRYDLGHAAQTLTRGSLPGRVASLWRYREVLPVADAAFITTLGEGWTPLVQARRLGGRLGMPRLRLKDESINPTGSFKARGMTAAVSMAKELGAERLAVPSAGNASGALAAYAARAGLEAHIYMPRDASRASVVECRQYGAQVVLVDGFINDCGRIIAERKEREGWFDVSTLKEPYRAEGKKTIAYELAEQMEWTLPDVVLYPTGGGTGLIGMWKAFDEMQELGWIGSKRPRMVSVQAEGCAPIVNAFMAGAATAEAVAQPVTVAAGLRVPVAIGDFMILDILRKSGGTAVSVSDEQILESVRELASAEGVFAAPEAGACVAALHGLLERGAVDREEEVVLVITGSGLRYPHLWNDLP